MVLKTATEILEHPDARLRRISSEVTGFGADLHARFVQLDAVMRAGPGGVGIAAPQIGWLERMIVVDCRESLRPCKNNGLLWMSNPLIESVEGKALGREGCLSVPDWVAMVERARTVVVSYDNIEGERLDLECTGFEARVIQHELDHLNGILFIDRVVSSRDLVRRMAV
ncbi:MAG: peptide deformylase [Zetaproteobacteria bacterium CG12_big_fil_rev_8_21_14_0_65_54_13]|nr:MAG: peptide deformylase [Zetaproteobacteria bacterium CG23_combo_of_CG06-09_8_20_14_all_54_7]PIW49200.1 MAG: peptide deformylase [Zetaproteobacteria bacterium CG12_big_fil_rev_8_21_14_0_65_54_13]PIX55467.1 MAG: peptide deformylase [Zetaproteobacteria bacterium CG_4_10_14_3_um_filter_54_28]PJA29215.1 MAG: peptide deformylase [Zetaproteobacteria bacterium CG_4_9_14_3_um_filter_54_145]